MGFDVTALAQKARTATLIVDSDLNMGSYDVIATDVKGGTAEFTEFVGGVGNFTNVLVSNSINIKPTYNISMLDETADMYMASANCIPLCIMIHGSTVSGTMRARATHTSPYPCYIAAITPTHDTRLYELTSTFQDYTISNAHLIYFYALGGGTVYWNKFNIE